MSVDPSKPVVFEIIYDDFEVENILKTAGGFAATQGIPTKSPQKSNTPTKQPVVKVETSPQTKQTGRAPQKRGKESISAAVLRIAAKARKANEVAEPPTSAEPEIATQEKEENSYVGKTETVQVDQSPERKHHPIRLIINSPRVAVSDGERRFSPYKHRKQAEAGEDVGKDILENALDSVQEVGVEEGDEVEYIEVEEELPELYSDEEDARDGETQNQDGANEIVIVQNVHNELEREMLEHEMEDVHALAEFAALAHQEELKAEPMEQMEYPTSSRYHTGAVLKSDQYDAEVVSLTEADFLATKKKPFVCEICYKGYSEKYTLKVHMRLHTGENPYPCADCKKGFPTKTQLDSHMRKHYSEKVMCEVCKLIVDNKHQLSTHMKESGCIADVTCKICHKTFHNRSNLSRHVLLHSSVYPFNCEFCDRSFAVRASYDRHMRSHSDLKEHICESCGRGFNQKTEWKLHMARCDMSVTPYQCKICKRAFADKGHLIKHMEKHDPGNPHVCGVCHKTFSNANSLRLHGFIHTGNYPLQCQFCSKGFTTRSTLRAHMTVHTGERPYPCKYCGKAFAQMPGLRAHVTLVHPEDVAQQAQEEPVTQEA